MSFDLGVWFEADPTTAVAAADKHQRLCGEDLTGAVTDGRVTAFYQALTARYPEIDEVADADLDHGRTTITGARESTSRCVRKTIMSIHLQIRRTACAPYAL